MNIYLDFTTGKATVYEPTSNSATDLKVGQIVYGWPKPPKEKN